MSLEENISLPPSETYIIMEYTSLSDPDSNALKYIQYSKDDFNLSLLSHTIVQSRTFQGMHRYPLQDRRLSINGTDFHKTARPKPPFPYSKWITDALFVTFCLLQMSRFTGFEQSCQDAHAFHYMETE